MEALSHHTHKSPSPHTPQSKWDKAQQFSYHQTNIVFQQKHEASCHDEAKEHEKGGGVSGEDR